MPAKKRCQFHLGTDSQCSSAALRIIGECALCRSQFCGSVCRPLFLFPFRSVSLDMFSIVCRNTMSVATLRTAGSKHSSAIRASWRANGPSPPRLLRPDLVSRTPSPPLPSHPGHDHDPPQHSRSTRSRTDHNNDVSRPRASIPFTVGQDLHSQVFCYLSTRLLWTIPLPSPYFTNCTSVI